METNEVPPMTVRVSEDFVPQGYETLYKSYSANLLSTVHFRGNSIFLNVAYEKFRGLSKIMEKTQYEFRKLAELKAFLGHPGLAIYSDRWNFDIPSNITCEQLVPFYHALREQKKCDSMLRAAFHAVTDRGCFI